MSWRGWVLVIAFVAAAAVVAVSALGGASEDGSTSAKGAEPARAALRGKTQCADIDVITLTPPMVSTLRDYQSSIVTLDPLAADAYRSGVITREWDVVFQHSGRALVFDDGPPSLSTRLRRALRELRDRANAEQPDPTPVLDAAACNQ